MSLGEPALALLGTVLRDPAVLARYQSKIVQVPGSDCWWWRCAISGRGHGRFYVGASPPSATGNRGGTW